MASTERAKLAAIAAAMLSLKGIVDFARGNLRRVEADLQQEYEKLIDGFENLILWVNLLKLQTGRSD